MITEVVGKKLGMTQLFDEDGNCIGVTLVEVAPVCILEKVSYSTKERVKIGCFKIPQAKQQRVKRPLLGYFKKAGVSAYKMLKEVAPDPNQECAPGKEVGVEIFEEGEEVHVRGKIIGKGFQGGMKRHGWHGQPGSHGSTSHRRIGSSGASTFPGKVIKGIHMPGHMGDAYRTIKNLKIVKIDKERNVLFLKGAVPGSRNSIIEIKKKKQ